MNQDISFNKKIQLLVVKLWKNWLNFWLDFFQRILFKKLKSAPKNILIHKIGNIGDIVFAVPSFINIRYAYPDAKITLLSSSGKKGSVGAKELLNGVWYFDKQIIYYAEDIDSFKKKKDFVRNLRENHYDLFIQLPDDLANFRILMRNMIFAKLLKAKSAFGFKIRTTQIFKKTQVDFLFDKTEAEGLFELLKENGIGVLKAEFNFYVSDSSKNKVKNLLNKKWPNLNKKIVAVIGPGCKREGNRWPIERFAQTAKYLENKYQAKIIIVGGRDDLARAKIIESGLKKENVLITAGKLEPLETFELLKYCSFLISNSTGVIHLGAAVGLPCVGVYSIRDVFGRWFPYGKNHKILYHKFIDCDYRNEDCIKKSVEMISVEEVKNACDELLISKKI